MLHVYGNNEVHLIKSSKLLIPVAGYPWLYKVNVFAQHEQPTKKQNLQNHFSESVLVLCNFFWNKTWIQVFNSYLIQIFHFYKIASEKV